MNSINFIGQAIEYEARRQIEILEDGGAIDQETRLFDPNKGETRSMRSKEEAHDYRYFPDPDLPPLVVSEAELEAARRSLPELPEDLAVAGFENAAESQQPSDVRIARYEAIANLSGSSVADNSSSTWAIHAASSQAGMITAYRGCEVRGTERVGERVSTVFKSSKCYLIRGTCFRTSSIFS